METVRSHQRNDSSDGIWFLLFLVLFCYFANGSGTGNGLGRDRRPESGRPVRKLPIIQMRDDDNPMKMLAEVTERKEFKRYRGGKMTR